MLLPSQPGRRQLLGCQKLDRRSRLDQSGSRVLPTRFEPYTHLSHYRVQKGLSRKHIFDAVDASVARLGTYIDVLQIHRLDPEVPAEEIMEALHDVVKSGKVRYIGASSMWAHEFATLQFTAEKHGWTKFISMQNFYNLLYREEVRLSIFPLAFDEFL